MFGKYFFISCKYEMLSVFIVRQCDRPCGYEVQMLLLQGKDVLVGGTQPDQGPGRAHWNVQPICSRVTTLAYM